MMSTKDEDKISSVRRRNRGDCSGMRLHDSESGQGDEDEGTWRPFLELSTLDYNLCHTAVFSDQSGSSRSNVIPGVAGCADQTIENVQTDRDPDIDSRVECSWREMKHDTDDEAEECEDMLNDEEFVPKVANWGEGAEIHPDEEGVRFDSFQISKVSFLAWRIVTSVITYLLEDKYQLTTPAGGDRDYSTVPAVSPCV
jgi:hypothetical protein